MIESIQNDWNKKLGKLFKSSKELSIISPYITNKKIINEYFNLKKKIRLITRSNKKDFILGASDINSLEILYKNKIPVKLNEESLHSKIYLFDDRVLITSLNLTSNGFNVNLEYGVIINNKNTVKKAKNYFEKLWKNGYELNQEFIEEIKNDIEMLKEKIKVINEINSLYYGKKLFLIYFEESKHRNWEDAINYGFISAGMDKKYSGDLQKLRPGDKVLVKLLNRNNSSKNISYGYVAYGEVLEKALMAKDIKIGKRKLVDLSKCLNHHSKDKEKCEWVVRVKWLSHPLLAANGINEKGLYYVPFRVVSEINKNNHRYPVTEKRLKEKHLIV